VNDLGTIECDVTEAELCLLAGESEPRGSRSRLISMLVKGRWLMARPYTDCSVSRVIQYSKGVCCSPNDGEDAEWLLGDGRRPDFAVDASLLMNHFRVDVFNCGSAEATMCCCY
jgi:hypothetical protein